MARGGALAEMADNEMQRRGEGRGLGAEMTERDQRQRRIEHVHLGGDQFVLHITEYPAADESEAATRIDRLSRRGRQRRERRVAAAEIGTIEFRQVIDMRPRIGERTA